MVEEKQSEFLIKEIKELTKIFKEELKQLELQTMNSLKSLEEKYTSALELLKNKIKDEPKPLNPSLLKE